MFAYILLTLPNFTDFWITSVKSGFNTVRVKPRATLGLIFFTIVIQRSEKQRKVLSHCLNNFPLGIPSGFQTFPLESLKTLRNSLGQIFTDNHCRLSTEYHTYASYFSEFMEILAKTFVALACQCAWFKIQPT